MTGLWLWMLAAVLLAANLLRGVLAEMLCEEARTRLTLVPRALIRLASARLPRELRADLVGEWSAELEHVLRNTDGLPATRLVRGIRYSAGLLLSAQAVADGMTGRGNRARRVARFVAAMVAGSLAIGTVAQGATAIIGQGRLAYGAGTLCMAIPPAGFSLWMIFNRYVFFPLGSVAGVPGQFLIFLAEPKASNLASAYVLLGLSVLTLSLMVINRLLHRAHRPEHPDCPSRIT